MKTQLQLKGIIAEDEWDNLKNDIIVDFNRDNHFTELKDAEIMRERLQTLDLMQNYIGDYYSKEWVMKNVLMFTDEDIEKMSQQASEEEPEQDDLPDEEPQGDDDE